MFISHFLLVKLRNHLPGFKDEILAGMNLRVAQDAIIPTNRPVIVPYLRLASACTHFSDKEHAHSCSLVELLVVDLVHHSRF